MRDFAVRQDQVVERRTSTRGAHVAAERGVVLRAPGGRRRDAALELLVGDDADDMRDDTAIAGDAVGCRSPRRSGSKAGYGGS